MKTETLSVKVTENKTHNLVLALQNGKFSEGDFKGEYYTDGVTMLFNLDDKRQFSVYVKDILIALKEKLETKTDPSGHYEKKNGEWKSKK